MNIKSRLKKLEKHSYFSVFCLCFGRFPKYPFVLDIEERTLDYCKPLQDVCESCRKRVDKSRVQALTEWQSAVENRVKQAAETMAYFQD